MFYKEDMSSETAEGFRAFFSQLDLIGVSLYEPFQGEDVERLKKEQLAKFLEFLTRMKDFVEPDARWAVLEFGVNNRHRPSSWHKESMNIQDQSNAYRAWLDLLNRKTLPTMDYYSFWVGKVDPRHSIAEHLKRFLKRRP
jgi:hypothetical protein